MLYGSETRSPVPKHVAKMQTIINGYERRLAQGPRGGLKDMRGKMTQTDILAMLGTCTVQFEIDIRILWYVGHIVQISEDRWERERRPLFWGRRSIHTGSDMRWQRHMVGKGSEADKRRHAGT